jgi:hypothetical protein
LSGPFFAPDQEVAMRNYLLPITAAIALLSLSVPASAQDKWCLQGSTWGYPGNCQFATYDQCMASASGTYSYCGIDPRFAFAQQYRGYPRDYGYPRGYREIEYLTGSEHQLDSQ